MPESEVEWDEWWCAVAELRRVRDYAGVLKACEEAERRVPPGKAGAASRASVLSVRATTLILMGKTAPAEADLDLAADLAFESGDRATQGQVCSALALLASETGEVAKADWALKRRMASAGEPADVAETLSALHELHRLRDPELALLYIGWAHLIDRARCAHEQLRFAHLVRMGRLAEVEAVASAPHELVPDLVSVACATWALGDYHGALALYAELAQRAADAGLPDLADEARRAADRARRLVALAGSRSGDVVSAGDGDGESEGACSA